MSSSKPFDSEIETVEALGAEHLEHGVHVGDPLLVQRAVRPGEQHLSEVEEQPAHRRGVVPPDLPVVEAEAARPEHEAGLVLEQRLEERVVVVDVVLEVRVLDQHDGPGDMRQAGAHRVALAAGPVLEHHPHVGPSAIALDDGPRPVGGVALDDDQLTVDLQGLGQHRVDDLCGVPGLVVDRHHDRQLLAVAHVGGAAAEDRDPVPGAHRHLHASRGAWPAAPSRARAARRSWRRCPRRSEPSV